FGYMAPGETRTWQVKTKVAKDVAARADMLSLQLEDDRGQTKAVGNLQVSTRDVPHPQLAYHFVMDDSERGDGDGQLEVGEGVEFVVMVTNTGDGVADEVSLRLKSAAKEDLFLERGRAVVGKIGPGETKSGRLKFRVPEAQSGRDVLPIELTIYDTGTGEWTEDRINLKAKPNKKTKGAALKHIARFTRTTQVRASTDRKAPIIATVSKGRRLAAVRKADGAIQVDLQNGVRGWVPQRSVRLSRRKADPKSKRGTVAFHPRQRPPTIEFDEQLAGSVVTADNVLLSGTVYGRQLRDMYVLLNDEKVFFASGPKAKAASQASEEMPDERAVKLPFEVPLKLKEGLNKVLIVGRLNEQVVSYRRMFITRRSTRGAEVAKAEEKTTADKQSR
ncbi:MAG: SH3 domain-containing protein, partial [Planctomycetota bacterium]